ncbi:helix-turn-helix domain-containing protein [Cesiribacter andamanensis]|uniref:Putative transcriptional regulator n=1 Tax=Cesiribacter andamanensis AMV16 TaxID=1279009 RepID=M7N8T1_9BACT|nr:XRE family transcriptional regulator [Cesiribacter andamanensis]EMR03667.1 putative transcriptional regulator [Cesiribacter andamanensis AMV16]
MTDDTIRLIFGLKMRQLRLDRKISLTDLAARTGISVSYLNEIEKGKKYPKGTKIAALAEALDAEYDYLVSLQLSKKMAPIAELLQSNLLHELPLELFGIEVPDLLEILSNAPSKLSAFVSTLVEISRTYDMRVEHFYFSALRSYQEMHENYFEELEEAAQQFRQAHQLPEGEALAAGDLARLLQDVYGYGLDEQSLANMPKLQHLRTITLPDPRQPMLYLHPALDERQQAFAYGRELAYTYLKLSERSYTTSWVEVDSFEQVLNNFKASYFSCALLMPRQPLLEQLREWLQQREWQPDFLLQLMQGWGATPEMLLHRLTNLLPRFFGLRELFFLRFNHPIGSQHFYLTKEMHLSGLHNPHGSMMNEHYCRRWISLTVFAELDQQPTPSLLCRVQRSKYIGSENEYLVLSLAKAHNPQPDRNSSLSIGLRISEALKRKVRWWNDAAIPVRWVNETCERCPAVDCQERAVPPRILQQQNQVNETKWALQELKQKRAEETEASRS